MSDWGRCGAVSVGFPAAAFRPVGTSQKVRAEDSALMTGSALLDAAGRRRSPATMPGFHCGRPPRNKGLRYHADPPTVEEIVAVMRRAGDSAHGLRTRALVVLLWRAGLRITEALGVAESDLDAARGRVLIRRGKNGKRREVGMDVWGWQQLSVWLAVRVDMRVGALLCVIDGPTQGRPWSATAARATLRELAVAAGVAAIRATSTPTRARRRDGPRRHSLKRHSKATRARQPRNHLDLPARHRQQRNHQHRPQPTRADAPG